MIASLDWLLFSQGSFIKTTNYHFRGQLDEFTTNDQGVYTSIWDGIR